MNGNNIDTLFELLNAFKKVEVPIVQRDYAQGRKGEDTEMVRQNLLADMKAAILKETPPLDLNFIYGKSENGKFIPVDGQQRLTTLFLLHLFAFRDDESKTDILNKFTYETRSSSRDFIERLTENIACVIESDLSPSDEIEDCEWFVSGWKNDPTIQSIFVVLDEIKIMFIDIDDLDLLLLDTDYKPIVFKFLEMEDLGMEDSLYIKLNARGKPLTPFENFKARLIGRLQKLMPDLTQEFERQFDGKWADLFWVKGKTRFDQIYLAFFGVLLMNKGTIRTDSKWSNTLDFNLIDEEAFLTAFYTLNFLSENPDKKTAHRFVFNALEEKSTYPQRVLFHAVTKYLYKSGGVSTGSLGQWLRIIKNLTLNSQVDDYTKNYRPAIEGINRVSENWDSLLDYLTKGGSIRGFSPDQVKEEQAKAKILLDDINFAKVIYEAEKHPYFCGQIRSALYYAINDDGSVDYAVFTSYWSKISSLFDKTKPTHGHLLRQALLSLGDYTMNVGDYKTLCVDDPNEGASTHSLKKLFSNNDNTVKQLLDSLTVGGDLEQQLKAIVKNANIPQSDWRYCFVRFPELFKKMSVSHLRLRIVHRVNGNKERSSEFIIVPNVSSNGYNYDIYLSALQLLLKRKNIDSNFDFGSMGTWGERYLTVGDYWVQYKNGRLVFVDENDVVKFETTLGNLLTEAEEFVLL